MTQGGSNMLTAYKLGATLYMPVTHPKVPDIFSGRVAAPASSIVLCLEDALPAQDVERGVRILTALLTESVRHMEMRPLVFIRPRSYDMAFHLRAVRGIELMDGFVIPKACPETLSEWADLLPGTHLSLMPTMETLDLFDPSRMIQFRDILLKVGLDRIAAVRIGGNDLLASMALRRVRGITSYEGPLAWFMSMAAGLLIPHEIPVAAPVFDIIDDLQTLKREVERDVQMGFVSKTAIHPVQVPVIEGAFAVLSEEVQVAEAILDHNGRAVFQSGGVMCEPATHTAWAHRTLARAGQYNFTPSAVRLAKK